MSNYRFDMYTQAAQVVDYSATKLLYVSTAKYGGDWISELHTHAFSEIFYVVGGAGQFKIDDLTYPVEVDDMVVVNPNVRHTEVGVSSSPLEYIVMGIDGLEFSVFDESGEDRFSVVNFRSAREEVLHYLRSMLRELEYKTPGYTTVCQNLLEILLLHLMRRTDFSLTPVQPGHGSYHGCAAVRRYIDNHYKESISLDQLARLSHFNKHYMAHSFTKQYGVSPINYLIARRIEESKRLLADTDHSLSQISGNLGFSSPSYFSQSFRKAEGMSPVEFRRQRRG